MSLPSKSRNTSRTRSNPTDRAVASLQRRYARYNSVQLAWLDSLALCAAFGIEVDVRKVRQDALAARRNGRSVILVSDRVHRESWGVFCVVHELAHLVVHPGPREFYLGSPAWYSKVESQANALALVALWPHKSELPYPRILQIEPQDDAITLHLGVTTMGPVDASPRWTSRDLTLQRYV